MVPSTPPTNASPTAGRPLNVLLYPPTFHLIYEHPIGPRPDFPEANIPAP